MKVPVEEKIESLLPWIPVSLESYTVVGRGLNRAQGLGLTLQMFTSGCLRMEKLLSS